VCPMHSASKQAKRPSGNVGASAGNASQGHRSVHGVRPRQAMKRATFAWINSQIVAVSSTGDWRRLLSSIEAHLSMMNLVNMSTALHRLAKLTAGEHQAQAALKEHQTFAYLVATVLAALRRADVAGLTLHSQALSNIAWSFATLRCAELDLLRTVATLSRRLVVCFKPFELSTTLWAFAKLGAVDTDACRCAEPLFEAACKYIPQHVKEFSFRCLVSTAWAFAMAQYNDPDLFKAIAIQMAPDMRNASNQDIANIGWAFDRTGLLKDSCCDELAKSLRRLGDCKLQAGHAAFTSSTFTGGFSPTKCKATRAPLSESITTGTKVEPCAMEKMDCMEAQAAEDMSKVATSMGFVCSVKNTFFHFEPSCPISEVLEGWSLMEQHLTPDERAGLLEFRSKYRAWRKFDCRGAKAEPGAVVSSLMSPTTRSVVVKFAL